MNSDQLKDSQIDIGGKPILTNWLDLKIAAPDNLQHNIRIQKDLKKVLKEQKKIMSETTNAI